MRKYDRLRHFVRDRIPDTPGMRRYISNKMEKAVLATLIPEDDVVIGEQSFSNKEQMLSKSSMWLQLWQAPLLST